MTASAPGGDQVERPELLSQERMLRAETEAGQVLDIAECLEGAIDRDDESAALQWAAALVALVSGLGLDWLELIASESLADAAALAELVSISHAFTPNATADDHGAAAFWGDLQAELLGGYDQLELERAQEIVSYRVQQVYQLRNSDTPARDFWHLMSPLVALEPYWPDLSEIGGSPLMHLMLARGAAAARDIDAAQRLLSRFEMCRSALDDEMRSELLQVEMQVAHQLGRTDEIERLLRSGLAQTRTRPDAELERQLMGMAVATGMTRRLGLSEEAVAGLLRRSGVTEAETRLRLDALDLWRCYSQYTLGESTDAPPDPGAFESLARRADVASEPSIHVVSLLMAAMSAISGGDHSGAVSYSAQGRTALADASRAALGGFPELQLAALCDQVEAARLLSAGDGAAALPVIRRTYELAVERRSWLMAALGSASLGLATSDALGALLHDVEALALLGHLQTQLPSSTERARYRESLSVITAHAFAAAARVGDPAAMAELIELVRGQSMPTASVTPGDAEQALPRLMFQQALGLVMTDADAETWGEEHDLTLLAPPAPTRMPWPDDTFAAAVHQVDRLLGRPALPTVELTVAR